MTSAILGAAAAAWGIIMALAPALQIRRMLITRSSRDVSTGYYLLLLPGFLLWVAYGTASNDPDLAIPNTVSAIVAVLLIAIAQKLRR